MKKKNIKKFMKKPRRPAASHPGKRRPSPRSARPHRTSVRAEGLTAPEAVGRFSGSRRGFGFVEREDAPDVFVPAGRTMGALDGDTVRVAILREGERPEGEILEVLTLAHPTLFGTAVRDTDLDLRPRGEVWLLPDHPHLPPHRLLGDRVRLGDKIEARPLSQGEAVFVRSYGRATSRYANYAAILAECAVPTDFSPAALEEATSVASRPLSEEGRIRPRDVILTIDGAGAKDLDDAISVRRRGDGFVLGVHIADVSHYVAPGSALDAAAHERGSSVYFADRVVPMLPEALSNGACSLNAGEDKYALTAEMTLDANGEIKKTKLYKSIIKSRVRGVYSEVNDLFEKGDASPYYPKYREVYATLGKMRELYAILAERDRRRGILTLETAEPVILLDDAGEPTEIGRAERGEAERLIEAFMLTANRAVATLLTERSIPCVYRIHEPPPPEKYRELCDYLTSLSLPHPWRRDEEPSSAALSRLLAEAAERGLSAPVSMTVLRSLSKARYEAKPTPHFGLALPLYCHFTSPIRRLSDLVTHRIISAVLLGGAPVTKYRASARRGAEAATEGELRAVTAERRIEALYKTVYMKQHIGEVFGGMITSVTPHGYYVELDNTCEGLVPLSLLDGDYRYDERRRTLTRGATVIAVGDTATVRVKDADVSLGKVTFEPSKK